MDVFLSQKGKSQLFTFSRGCTILIGLNQINKTPTIWRKHILRPIQISYTPQGEGGCQMLNVQVLVGLLDAKSLFLIIENDDLS